MKNQFCALIVLLLLALLPAAAEAQALPDNPAPQPPDPAWNRVQSLTAGQAIVVQDIHGPAVHCLFTRATDAYLDCSPAGNPAGVDFRFNRADILGVDLDLPVRTHGRARHGERNYHPAWLSCMIAGGLVVGITAAHNTDAGSAAKDGLIGAAVVGTIGAPLAFLSNPYAASGSANFPWFGFGIPLALPHRHMHLDARSDE